MTQVRHARRVHARQLRHVVARLPDVHRRDAQRHQPPVRDVRQRRRRHASSARSARTRRRAPGTGRTRRCRRRKWSQRNNNNYEQTGLLDLAATISPTTSKQFLQNFYLKSKRSILKPKTEGPAAYVFPADDPRPGAQAELLRILQLQGVEISRATAPFTVTIREERPAVG